MHGAVEVHQLVQQRRCGVGEISVLEAECASADAGRTAGVSQELNSVLNYYCNGVRTGTCSKLFSY